LPHIAIDRHQLRNGLRITLSHDNRSPIVAVNLWYAVGSGNEKPGKTGFAHLFEHMMFQGSTNVAKGEHFSLVEASGGRANASTSWDRTNYFESPTGPRTRSCRHSSFPKGTRTSIPSSARWRISTPPRSPM
jgi:predicted Zn-dependent peptidase